MTDPMKPNHDQPVEGSRSESYTRPDDANVGSSTGSTGSTGDDTANGASAKATDVLEQIREAVEDFAEKAAPVVRQFSAKAAEIVASAADKAAPAAQKAGEVAADASGKLAVKSRSWAADVRESLDNATDTNHKSDPPTSV